MNRISFMIGFYCVVATVHASDHITENASGNALQDQAFVDGVIKNITTILGVLDLLKHEVISINDRLAHMSVRVALLENLEMNTQDDLSEGEIRRSISVDSNQLLASCHVRKRASTMNSSYCSSCDDERSRSVDSLDKLPPFGKLRRIHKFHHNLHKVDQKKLHDSPTISEESSDEF